MIKKIILIMLFFSVLTLIMPVNSLSIQKLDSDSVVYHKGNIHLHMKNKYDECYVKHDKKCKYYGYSQIHVDISGPKSELNKVKKVTVKINGKLIKTYKNIDFSKSHLNNLYYDKAFIKGDIKGKKFTIKVYGSNDKILKIKEGVITSTSKEPLFDASGYSVSPSDNIRHVP